MCIRDRYITDQGKTIESYEDSGVKTKDRSVDSFINWIEGKIMKGKIVSVVPASAPEHVYKRITKKHGNKPHGTNKKYKRRSQKNKSRKYKNKK